MIFKETNYTARIRYSLGTVIVAALCACTCAAQSSSSQEPAPPTAHLKLGSRASRPPATQTNPDAKNQAAPLPSDQAATPPQVDLNNGKLKVDAHNSDLSAILQDVAAQSGMTVDGLSRNTRVFGVYGPGSPHDVISDLLVGAGYNFVMVGGQNGSVPRELVLTAENGNPAGPGIPSRPGGESPDQDGNESEPVRSGPIAHPNQNDDDPDDPTHNPKRMEQHLENLRHMQDIIQQSQQNQQGEQEPDSEPQ